MPMFDFETQFADAVAGLAKAPKFVAEQIDSDFSVVYLPHLQTTGVGSVSLSPALSLPRNTLVERFDLIVGATRASRTPAQAAGQVRAYDNAGVHTVVIDFGVPRTVSSVSRGASTTPRIISVSAWLGTAFAAPFFGQDDASPVTAARFASEVRSERLLLKIDAAADAATIGAELLLELPELPADLELRINGGAPVWTQSGPAQPTNATAIATDAFNTDGHRRIELADALNALLADPLHDDALALDITLSAKVPGALTLDEESRSLRKIKRMDFSGDSSRTLSFDGEGRQSLALDLPALAAGTSRVINEIRFTAIATPPPERVLPPEGPPAATMSDGEVLAELLVDADRAAIVRLPAGADLAELGALRLPLAATGDGAEAQIVLWSGGSEPTQPIPGGTSKPLTIAAGDEAWLRFDFAKPVALDPAAPPWAALVVSRGTLVWALARKADAPECELRRGPPAGPWRALPPLFAGALIEARGRIRRVGNAPKSAPLAAWSAGLESDAATLAIAATAKGAALVLKPAAGATAALSLLAYCAASLTLRDIDVIWTETAV